MILPFDVVAICGFRATLLSYLPIASRIELSLFGKCSDFIPNRKVIRQIYYYHYRRCISAIWHPKSCFGIFFVDLSDHLDCFWGLARCPLKSFRGSLIPRSAVAVGSNATQFASRGCMIVRYCDCSDSAKQVNKGTFAGNNNYLSSVKIWTRRGNWKKFAARFGKIFV